MEDTHTVVASAAAPRLGALQEYVHALRAFSPSLQRFVAAMGLAAAAVFGVAGVLQNLYLRRIGLDAQFIGLIAGLGQAAWALFALPVGTLANRIGLRDGLMSGFACMGIGLVLLLSSASLPGVLLRACLIAGQVVSGLGAALISVNIPPYVMAVTSEAERRHAFASVSAIMPAMSLVGSAIGGALPGLLASVLRVGINDAGPYRLVLALTPALLLCSVLVLAKAEPAYVEATPQPTSRSSGALEADRVPLFAMALLGLATYLGSTGEGALRTFFNVYLDSVLGVTPAAIGAIMGSAQILPVLMALAAPILLLRLGTRHTLTVGMIGVGACLFSLAAAPQVGVAAVSYMGASAMVALGTVARDMLGQELVTPRWRTRSQAVAMIGMSLGWSTTGIVGGYLITIFGFGTLFTSAACGALLAAVLLILWRRRTNDLPQTRA